MPERSLWPCLHDSILDRIVTDYDTGTVTLTFRIAHINRYAGLSSRLRFVLVLSGVRGLMLTRTVSVSTDAENRTLTQSLDWTTVAPPLPRKRFEVLEPSLSEEDGVVTLALQGLAHARDSRYLSISMTIEAERITAERSDGRTPFDLETLEALGSGYWEAWQAKRKVSE